MKAMLYRASGGPEVLEYTDVDDPVPGDGDVVVEVAATALNRLDLLQRTPGPTPSVSGQPRSVPTTYSTTAPVT